MRVYQSLLSKLATAFAVAVIAPSLLADTPLVEKTWYVENVKTDYSAMPTGDGTNTLYGSWGIPEGDGSTFQQGTGILLDTGDTAITYTPSNASVATLPVTLTFNVAFTSTTELPEIPAEAQLAVTAANTHNTGAAYYIYLGSGTWTRLYGATPGSASVPVVVDINYGTHRATVTVGSTPLYLSENDSSTTALTIPQAASQVNSLAFKGSGTLGDFSGLDSREAAYALARGNVTNNYETLEAAIADWETNDKLLQWTESEGTWSASVKYFAITWTDHSGTNRTDWLEYGETPTAPTADPVSYTEGSTIFTGTWPVPSDVTGDHEYAAVYTGTAAKASVLTITDNGATTNTVGYYASLAAAVTAAPAGSTVVLLADDSVSLTDGGEITINKSLTITGPVAANGEPLYTIYGKNTVAGSNDIFITGDGTVTLSNVKIAQFGNVAASDIGHAPVYVSKNFSGTFNIDNVYITEFNRAGLILCGSGEFNVTDCYIDCANSQSGAFTKGIEIKGSADGTIKDTVIVNMERSSTAWMPAGIEITGNGDIVVDGCTIISDSGSHQSVKSTYGIVVDAAGENDPSGGSLLVTNCIIDTSNGALSIDEDYDVVVNGEDTSFGNYIVTWGDDSSITVNAGEFNEDVYADAGTITINGGTFNKFAPYAGESGTIAISGGIFDDEVAEKYCAAGFIPAVYDEESGLYTVLEGYKVTFVNYDGETVLFTTNVAVGGTAVYEGATPTKPADASYLYTWSGWTSGGVNYDTDDTLAAVTDAAQTYTATFSAAAPVATVFTVADGGATTNTVGTYASLADAIAAAPAGSTVLMLADETADATKTAQSDRLVVTNAITIDFGEYTYSVPGSLETSANWCALFIDADTTVKATTGGIDCLDKENNGGCGVYAFNVRNGATLTIDGGSYHGGGTVVQTQLGTTVINGGTFSVTAFDAPYGTDFALNCVDGNYTAGTAGFAINGGTFVGFDPQDIAAEGANTDFTSTGYVAIDDGNGNFVVQPGYNVTFDANGGAPAPAAQRVAAGGTATEPTGVTLANHSLRAWTLSNADYDFDTVLSADITLVADWTLDQHKVIWIVDGVETTNKVDYGTALSTIQPADPTKAGDANALYTFTGWSPAIAEGDTVTADVTYTAGFKTWTKVAVPAATTGLVYDGTVQTGVATGTGYLLSGNTGTAADDYTATATLADTANTVWADDTTAPTANAAKPIAWSIATRAITITADDAEKTSGDADPTFTASITSGSLANDQDIAYTFTRAPGDAVGTYAITPSATVTASGVDVTANYTITPVNGTLTVTAPAAPTVLSIALNTNAVDNVRNGTLAATSASGKTVTVEAMLGLDGEGNAQVTASPSPTGDVSVVGGVATATFATNWNSGVEWTLTSGEKSLVGKTYAKAETEWFTTNSVAEDSNLDFGETCKVGVKPVAATAANEAVRIEARIQVSASGPDEPPADIGSARGGFAVVGHEYVAFNGDGWVGLFGVEPKDGEVDLLMVADMAGNAQTIRYYVDGVSLWTTNDIPGEHVYAVSMGSGDSSLAAVGFSSAEIVKSAVVAEYDVSYVAAIGNTGYTDEAPAFAAIDKTGENALVILKGTFTTGIELAVGQSVVIDTSATGTSYTGSVTATAPANMVKTVTEGSVTTYTAVITPTYFIID